MVQYILTKTAEFMKFTPNKNWLNMYYYLVVSSQLSALMLTEIWLFLTFVSNFCLEQFVHVDLWIIYDDILYSITYFYITLS